MGRIITGIFLITLCSCASMYRAPESIQEKIVRYESRSMNLNPIPQMENLPPANPGRVPASAGPNQALAKYSNKRLYFLTLLDQYQQLSSYAPQESYKPIAFCPSFHTSFVEQRAKIFHPNQNRSNLNSNSNEGIASVALTKTAANFQSAFGLYVANIGKEIEELCETGTSDNYYLYENVVTSMETTPSNQYNEVVSTLHKLGPFFNRELLKELAKGEGGRSPASTITNPYLSEILYRMGKSWVSAY